MYSMSISKNQCHNACSILERGIKLEVRIVEISLKAHEFCIVEVRRGIWSVSLAIGEQTLL
ncbi:hypothetical protein Lal_00012792 [Lupinus albus]|nr:hypothetical protein Lal_00012792 [Lupinus albus]